MSACFCFAEVVDGILVAYATKHGPTHELAESIAAQLAEAGVETHALSASSVRSLDDYSAVVLGAPMFMGCWHRDACSFLRRFRTELADRPLAIFILGPSTDDGAVWEQARLGLDDALAHLPEVEPVSIGLFGGAIVPESLHFPLFGIAAGDLCDAAPIREWVDALPDVLGLRAAV